MVTMAVSRMLARSARAPAISHRPAINNGYSAMKNRSATDESGTSPFHTARSHQAMSPMVRASIPAPNKSQAMGLAGRRTAMPPKIVATAAISTARYVRAWPSVPVGR